MDFSKLNNKKVIIAVVVVILIIIISVVIYLKKKKNNNNEPLSNTPNNSPNNAPNNTPNVKPVVIPKSTENIIKEGKVLNYFGGKGCPHSNVNSMMYNIVFNKLKTKYPDVNINLFWGDEKKEEFKENNIQFVPTILNKSNDKVNTKMDNSNIDNVNDKELENLFLKNIYDQL
jgi:uncharacterized membrane protein YqiK